MMSDDSFIREVNEELRQDQAKALWDRYGPAFIGLAIVVVLFTAGYVGWQYWTETKANKSGDDFSAALLLANDGKADEALAALGALEKNGYGAYPLLARMRAATVLFEKGDFTGAVAGFDEVSSDKGSYADVSSRAEQLTNDTNTLRHSAREALGLSAWKSGKPKDAIALFDQIAADEGAPRNIRQRATLMSELIRGSGDAS